MPDALSAVDVVILAGGQGTRLAAVTAETPKPLAPVAGRPFLEHLLDQLRSYGARQVVLSLGYKPDVFSDYFRDHPPAGLDLKLAFERSPLGTGGGLRNAYPSLGSDTVLVLNGDSYVEADLGALVAFHRAKAAEITLLLTRVPDASRFGGVEVDASGAVTRFLEKGRTGPAFINAGVYVLQRTAVGAIPPARPVSLERDVFPARIGKRFFALGGDFPFIDIGTPESYREAHAFFKRKRTV